MKHYGRRLMRLLAVTVLGVGATTACNSGQARELRMPGYVADVPAGWVVDRDAEGVYHLAPAGDTSAHLRVKGIEAVDGPRRAGDEWLVRLLMGRAAPLRRSKGTVVAALPDTIVQEGTTSVHMRYWYVATKECRIPSG